MLTISFCQSLMASSIFWCWSYIMLNPVSIDMACIFPRLSVVRSIMRNLSAGDSIAHFISRFHYGLQTWYLDFIESILFHSHLFLTSPEKVVCHADKTHYIFFLLETLKILFKMEILPGGLKIRVVKEESFVSLPSEVQSRENYNAQKDACLFSPSVFFFKLRTIWWYLLCVSLTALQSLFLVKIRYLDIEDACHFFPHVLFLTIWSFWYLDWQNGIQIDISLLFLCFLAI